jgi:hypothetical protein
MANPVLVRDSLNTGKWYAYVPADKAGRFWARYDFALPNQNYLYAAYFSLSQICYGRVFEGQVVNPKRDLAGKWVESAAWGDIPLGPGSPWNGRAVSADGYYADVTLPAAHNLIKILACQYTSGAGGDTMQISWDDAASWAAASKDGLDITEQALGATNNGLTEYTVATAAVPGTRKLRIWRKGDGANKGVRIFAVRSWNTSAAGDPSTAASGIAVGHDMIDTIQGFSSSSKIDIRTADRSMVVLTEALSAHEFAISNGPHAGTLKLTGGGHFGTAPDYSYTYAGGTFTNGPLIQLGDSFVDSGGVWDATANPLGKVLTDTSIHIRSVGFPAWAAGNPPQIAWHYDLDGSGLGTAVALLAVDAVDFHETQMYSAMAPMRAALAGYYKTPLSETKYDLASASHATIDNASSFDVYIPAHAVKLHCAILGVSGGVSFEQTTKNKVYCRADPRGWGITIPAAYAAGTTYALGDVVTHTHGATKRAYVSLANDNTGNDPTDADTASWKIAFAMAAGGLCAFGSRHEVSFEDPAVNAGGYRSRY